MDPDLFCVCEQVPWTSYSYNDIRSDAAPLPLASCPVQGCRALLKLDPASSATETACRDYFLDRTKALVLEVLSSVAILGINAALAFAMKWLVRVEAHHYMGQLNKSLAYRLFFAQFINTACLILVINAPINKIVPVGFQTGKYEDMEPSWYAAVGSNLMITMLINMLTPHLLPLVKFLVWKYRQSETSRAGTRLTQRDLNKLFLGPNVAAQYPLRYAQIFTALFVTFVFSTGMPLMNVIAFASFLLAYWADKYFFLRFYRRPASYGNEMARAMTELIPIAIFLHLAFGCWALGQNAIFTDSGIDDPFRITKVVDGVVASIRRSAPTFVVQGAERVTKREVLPLFVLLVLMAAILVLHLFLKLIGGVVGSIFVMLTCGTCTTKDVTDDEEESFVPTYTEATSEKYYGTAYALHDAPTYSMLLNPQIAEAFAITPEFAKMHRKLSSLAEFRHGLNAQSFFAGSSSPKHARQATSESVPVSPPSKASGELSAATVTTAPTSGKPAATGSLAAGSATAVPLYTNPGDPIYGYDGMNDYYWDGTRDYQYGDTTAEPMDSETGAAVRALMTGAGLDVAMAASRLDCDATQLGYLMGHIPPGGAAAVPLAGGAPNAYGYALGAYGYGNQSTGNYHDEDGDYDGADAVPFDASDMQSRRYLQTQHVANGYYDSGATSVASSSMAGSTAAYAYGYNAPAPEYGAGYSGSGMQAQGSPSSVRDQNNQYTGAGV
jgi:hypothetical protein